MTRINAGSTLANQYAPPFVVSNSVATNWHLRWNANILAFEAYDPAENVIEAGFDVIEAALFTDVTQQVFVVPWAANSKASLIITIDGVKQQQDAYAVNIDVASNTTTVTLSDTVSNETVEILGLQTTGGATVNVYGPIGIDSNSSGTVDSAYDIGWFAPSKESLIVTIDGVKQATSAYSITPVPGSSYTDTRLSFPNRAMTFLTSASGAGVSGIDTATDVITTGDALGTLTHGFETGDGVYYGNGGGAAVTGLTNGDLYYVRRLSAFTLALYPTLIDAQGNTNRIDLTVNLAETHSITLISDPYLYINGGTISLNVAGTGYAPADIIAISGGTPATEALITVNTVGGSGEILTFTLSNAGEYIVFPGSPAATAAVTGIGVNATFNINKVTPRIEVIGISTSGETPASPVLATNLVEPDTSSTFGLYDSKTVTGSTQVLNFKAITAGTGITLTDVGGTAISISSANATPVFDANIGTGTDIAVINTGVTPNTVNFKGINFGERISQSPGTDASNIAINYDFAYLSSGAATINITTERLINVLAGGATVVNLPIASTIATGDTITIKDGNGTAVANNISVTPDASDNINGGADGVAVVLNTARAYITLYSDGTNWQIIGQG